MIGVEASRLVAKMGNVVHCVVAIGSQIADSMNKPSSLRTATSAIEIGILLGPQLKNTSSDLTLPGGKIPIRNVNSAYLAVSVPIYTPSPEPAANVIGAAVGILAADQFHSTSLANITVVVEPGWHGRGRRTGEPAKM